MIKIFYVVLLLIYKFYKLLIQIKKIKFNIKSKT